MVSPHQSHQSRPFTPSLPPGNEQHELQTVVVGEQLSVDYVVHELPSVDVHHSVQNDLDQTLLTRIRYLEAENNVLKTMKSKNHFRLNDIKHDDKLVRFYTGFVSYFLCWRFLSFWAWLFIT